MIKNKISIEIKKEDRIYEFICSPDSSLGEIHDVLSQMKFFIVDRINEEMAKEQEKK